MICSNMTLGLISLKAHQPPGLMSQQDWWFCKLICYNIKSNIITYIINIQYHLLQPRPLINTSALSSSLSINMISTTRVALGVLIITRSLVVHGCCISSSTNECHPEVECNTNQDWCVNPKGKHKCNRSGDYTWQVQVSCCIQFLKLRYVHTDNFNFIISYRTYFFWSMTFHHELRKIAAIR